MDKAENVELREQMANEVREDVTVACKHFNGTDDETIEEIALAHVRLCKDMTMCNSEDKAVYELGLAVQELYRRLQDAEERVSDLRGDY